MSEPAQPEPAQPLFYRSLEPLTAREHAHYRLKGGDYRFAADTAYVPIVVSEFANAGRSYPIVFAAKDATPLAILGLESANLFVAEGRWSDETYVPAYARRYPFGFLKIDESPRYALGIDAQYGTSASQEEGASGEPLFDNGEPTEVTRRALAFCEAFQDDAEATLAFGRALEGRDLLIERQADAVLPGGRMLSLNGFKIVDAERFAGLDGPTVAEWHARGWLALVTFHLASLDRFTDLMKRQTTRVAPGLELLGAVASEAPAKED